MERTDLLDMMTQRLQQLARAIGQQFGGRFAMDDGNREQTVFVGPEIGGTNAVSARVAQTGKKGHRTAVACGGEIFGTRPREQAHVFRQSDTGGPVFEVIVVAGGLNQSRR